MIDIDDMAASDDVLRVKDLTIDFPIQNGLLRAVDKASFRIRQGKTTALVGESGSGKSVCSQAIMSILPKIAKVAGGQIVFHDPATTAPPVNLLQFEPDSAEMRSYRGGRMSMIFQEPMTSLSPLHTVGDQISEALHLHRNVTKPEGRELSQDMLRLVGFPDPVRAMRTYPFELSGGLRQRAMIAMALVCRPALLIADEPTTALDVTIQAQILKLIGDLQSELKMAVLMITHDLGVVANVADEVVVMYRGRIVESGSLSHIFDAPEHPYLKALLHAVPRFNMAPGERLVPLREVKAEGGVLMQPKQAWPEGADAAGPLLQVSNLRKSFQTRKSSFWKPNDHAEIRAVNDVSFTIQRGECLGLVGESGCGKTTVSKMIMRALAPDAGTVTFNDRGTSTDVLALAGNELKQFRRRMQFIFQDPFGSLNPRMTIFDIIAEPLRIHQIGDDSSRAEMVKELLRLVGLDPRFLNRYPHSFSGGQRQRIGIARALSLQPDLLICDEPVSALDVSIQAQILNLLKDLQRELGLTYLFISHNLAVVNYLADRIAVMCAGRIVETAPRDQLFKAPVHPYTRALLAAVPEPDPDHPLDLTALRDGRASEPSAWPAPFTIIDVEPPLVDIGSGHLVRATHMETT